MESFNYQFNEDQFQEIFPFYVRFGSDLTIRSTGKSLQKIIGRTEGKSLLEVFTFVRPNFSIELTFEDFKRHSKTIIVLEAKNYPVQIRFRGQFYVDNAKDEIIYLNSPWLNNTLDLSIHKLSINDFAIHDPITDHLQLIQSKQIVNDDMRLLTRELTKQRDELLLKNETIEDLAQITQQNPQPVMCMNFEQELIFSNHPAKQLIENHNIDRHPLWKSLKNTFAANKYTAVEEELAIDNLVFLVTCVPFKEKGYFNVYFRDLTDIIRFQDELITTSSRLHTLINSMQSAVLAEDMNRFIILVNQKFCDLFEIPFSPDAMKGADCSNAAEQSKHLFADEIGFVQRIEEILFEQQPVYGDILKMKNGRILERDYIPIFEDNRYAGHIWKYQDITEIYLQKETSRRVEEKYQRIIEDLNFGLVEVDLDDNVTKVYPAFCELTGYSEAELLGNNLKNVLLHPDDKDVLSDQIEFRKQGESGVYEIRMRTKNGDVKWLIISGTPIFNFNNEVIGSLGIHLDITSRKQMEEDLRLANEKALASIKAKEMFLANMSHEIRTPLNVIIGMTDLLGESELTINQDNQLKAIKNSSENLLQLINDILDYSKMEAGHITIESLPFKLEDLITNLIAGFKHQAFEKQIALTSEIDPEIYPTLNGDYHKLNQVLINLISNALKFTEKGSVSIHIKCLQNDSTAQTIQFDILDTGIGISKENLTDIFDVFKQEDASISRKFGGTGLGLSISKNIVEKMGGTIAVHSTRGKGSVFSFELTFKKQLEAFEIQHENKLDISTLQSIRLLVAEDNQLNQILIKSILEKEHIQFDLANDGLEVIELLTNNVYDLILLDIQMPRMDGVTAAKHIRNVLKLTVPIIALTANASREDEKTYADAGMAGYVSKPYKRSRLFETMLEQLGRSFQPVSDQLSDDVYSMKNIEQIASGDQQFIDSIIETFKISTPQRLAEIAAGIQNKQIDLVLFSAHQLKASIDILEITSIQKTIRELEIEGKKENPNYQTLLEQYTTIESVISRVITNLDQTFLK
jgi:PAS domain S-box-containing protein